MFIESNALGAVSIRTELLSGVSVNGIGWINAWLVRLESTELLRLTGIGGNS
jgi:hypothetical protein